MKRRGAVLAACLLAAAACTRVATYESIAGVYDLTRVDGQPLPARTEPLPTRDGSPPPCSIEYHSGTLTLTTDRRFDLRYEIRNSCTGAVLSTPDGRGRYTREGSEITFRLGGTGLTVPGEVHGDEIVWKDVHELVFRRR